MTISSTNRTAGPFLGNGSDTTFPFTFKIFSIADLYLVKTVVATGVTTPLILTTDYIVSLNVDQNATPGGSVMLNTALATGSNLVITSNIAYLQPTDLTNGGGFYPSVITTALDRLTIFCQQLASLGTRALRLPLADTSLGAELPSAVSRANNLLGFDASGNPVAVVPASGSAADVLVQLANTSDPAKGATLVPTVSRVVSSIASLRALPKTGSPYAFLTGYYAPGDGGGGQYFYDAADTTSADNGGTVIVAADGGRWKLTSTGLISVRQLGAKGDNTSNDTPALQAAFAGLRGFSIPAGQYALASGITSDYSAADFPVTAVPSPRFNVTGESIANTILAYTGTGYALNLIGSDNTGVGQGIHGLDLLGNFTLLDKSNTRSNSGIFIKNKAYWKVSNVYCQYQDTGLELQSCFSSKVENAYFNYCNYGNFLTQSGAALGGINALEFDRVTYTGNLLAGVLAPNCQSAVTYRTCTFEGCGTMGNDGSGGWIGNVGGFGYAGPLVFDGCYFESNKGVADISIDNLSANPLVVQIRGCIFNRASGTDYTSQNISITSSGGGRVICQLSGNVFNSLADYVPSAARPFFVGTAGKVEFVDLGGNSYSETTSLNLEFTSGRSWSGLVSSAGALLAGGNGLFTASKVAVGVYRITGSFGKTANSYVVTATSNDTVGGISVERVVQSGASFDVVTSNAAGTLTDCPFSFDVKLFGGV